MHLPSCRRSNLVKILLGCLWLVLFGLLLQRDYFIQNLETREAAALERAERTGYQSIYFKDRKIGYVESQFIPDGEGVRVIQDGFMRLNVSGQQHPIELHLAALLDRDNRLLNFDFSFSSTFYRMKAAGEVDGTVVAFTLDTGNSTISDQIRLEAPPLLATSRRSYLLHQDITPGEKVRIPWFDPVSLTAKTSVLEYRGEEQVLIRERVHKLHRFTELFSGTRINSWLDDEGNVVKEESPAGFVFIREPEFQARKAIEDSSELLSSVAVNVTGEMVDLEGRSTMRYRLKLPPDTDFALDGGRQRFAGDILTATLETLPGDAAEPASCSGSGAALEASAYIQSEDPAIVARSAEITDGAASGLETVHRLADWVYDNLERRPVLGIPDALTTLRNRVGDCNEFASLFAALARAAGIPTTIAAGVVFHQGAFYYHAWNEVCLGGQWISIDTTTGQFPADLSHLKFVEGELQEQVQLGALLGTLEIEPLP